MCFTKINHHEIDPLEPTQWRPQIIKMQMFRRRRNVTYSEPNELQTPTNCFQKQNNCAFRWERTTKYNPQLLRVWTDSNTTKTMFLLTYEKK